MVRVARGPLPSGAEAMDLQRRLEGCAAFRADTARWLREAFPGKGLEKGIAPEVDTFERAPAPSLFSAPPVEAPRAPVVRRPSPVPNVAPPKVAPPRVATPPATARAAAVSAIDLDDVLPTIARGDPDRPAKLTARRLADSGELREAREDEAKGDGDGRLIRRNQEAEYHEDINAYETYRADRHWYDDYLLNRDRYRDDRYRINENQGDERRFLDRNADDRRMNDLADERRAEMSRLARRDFDAAADRIAADRREAELRATRDAEDRRARDADTARRDYERELERRRGR